MVPSPKVGGDGQRLMVGDEPMDGTAQCLFSKIPVVDALQFVQRQASGVGHRREAQIGRFGDQYREESRA